jgi:hypothetical protein
LADIKLENREVNIYNIDKNIEMISKEVLGINDVKSNELKRRHPGMGRRRRPEIGRKINEPYNRKRYDISSRIHLKTKLMNNDYKSSVDINNNLQVYEEEINFSYNIIEIIMNTFFFFCLPKYLERKKKLNEKANNLLYKKLDVTLYVKNVLLFDIMHQTLIDDKRNGIINFISRPTISTKSEDIELSEFYKTYSYSDFEKFNFEINELIKNPSLEKNEKNLLSLCIKNLREIVK